MQRTCDIDTAGPLPAGVARQALAIQRSRAFCWSVRAGFITRGVTYGVIGGLAAALALGAGSDGASPNQQGALALIADAPLGRVVIAVAAVGLLAYALWKLGLSVMGRGPEGGGGTSLKDRIANLSAGVVYLVFFAVALQVLIGAAGRQAGERAEAHGVLSWPGGQFIVGAAGAILVAVSLFQCYEAVRGQFIDDNKPHEMGRVEERVFAGIGRRRSHRPRRRVRARRLLPVPDGDRVQGDRRRPRRHPGKGSSAAVRQLAARIRGCRPPDLRRILVLRGPLPAAVGPRLGGGL